jgi:hypothetical protein
MRKLGEVKISAAPLPKAPSKYQPPKSVYIVIHGTGGGEFLDEYWTTGESLSDYESNTRFARYELNGVVKLETKLVAEEQK